MYLGDNFIVGGITALVEEFRSSPAGRADHAHAGWPTRGSSASPSWTAPAQVVGLEEKPQQPKSDLALVGVYIFTPAVHEAVRQLKPSWRGELEITEAIQWLIDHGHKVRSTIITGYWKDTGNVADMLEVNRHGAGEHRPAVSTARSMTPSEIIGRVVVEAGARSAARASSDPAIIGAGTRVTGSYVGPFTSVAQDCAIADSEIEYSIVLRGALHPRGAADRGVAHRPRCGGHPGAKSRRPTGWFSAITARCRSAHEDSGNRRRRVHRLALCPHAAGRRLPRLRGRAASPCWTS